MKGKGKWDTSSSSLFLQWERNERESKRIFVPKVKQGCPSTTNIHERPTKQNRRGKKRERETTTPYQSSSIHTHCHLLSDIHNIRGKDWQQLELSLSLSLITLLSLELQWKDQLNRVYCISFVSRLPSIPTPSLFITQEVITRYYTVKLKDITPSVPPSSPSIVRHQEYTTSKAFINERTMMISKNENGKRTNFWSDFLFFSLHYILLHFACYFWKNALTHTHTHRLLCLSGFKWGGRWMRREGHG